MFLIFANAGLPMIGVQMHLMVVALLPIIAIEAAVFRLMLAVPVRHALVGALLSNALSTFVGIPLAWLSLVFLELVATNGGEAWGLDTPLLKVAAVTVQAPWLIPYEDDLYWMVPAASLVLLFPCFAVSATIEAWTLIRLWPTTARKRIWGATWVANLLSYALLFAYAAVRLYQVIGTRF
jgi:hypothetical protein